MKTRFLLVALAACLCLAPAAHAQVKLGVVDVQRVIDESNRGKEARALLQKRFDEEKANLDKKGKEIELFKEDLEKQGLALTPEKRAEKDDELQRRITEFGRLKKDKQDEFNKQQMAILREVMGAVMKVIQAYGEEQGYTAILDGTQGPVLFAGKGVDLTPQIVERFNQSAGSKATSKPSGK